MSANTTPIFTLTPNIGMARITTATPARDGSGSVATAFTAGASGSRVETVTFNSAQAAAGASSAMVGRVFISDTAGSGSNLRLLSEIAIATVTPSATAIGATQTISYPGGLIIPSGSWLGAAISVYAGVADQMDVITRGGDY